MINLVAEFTTGQLVAVNRSTFAYVKLVSHLAKVQVIIGQAFHIVQQKLIYIYISIYIYIYTIHTYMNDCYLTV